MSTARQLLEEVDALMRRNRGAAEGGAREPQGKDSAAINQAIDAAERVEIDRLDAARNGRRKGQAAIDAAAESEAAAARHSDSSADSARNEGSGPEDIPLLTEVTDTQGVHDAGEQRVSVSHASSPESRQQLDDVPLLTDAVDESDALTFMGVPEGLDESLPLAGASHDAADSAVGAATPASDSLSHMAPIPRIADDEPTIERRVADVIEAPDSVAPESDVGAVSLGPESGDTPLDAASFGMTRDDEPTVAPEAGDPAAESVEWLGQMPEVASAPLTPDSAVAEPQFGAQLTTDGRLQGDEARWRALAEDIRMQVLQRIDIFTDAGLQEQLRERMQPIVNRASAELVNTINREVGQLMRAYVAEAIEREIDKWRHDTR
ncbi:MAG: hypothetical protein ABJC33_11515 [Betaproteobacteria bacterium]